MRQCCRFLKRSTNSGLFDHPYVDESKVESTLNRPEGRELARKVAARSMVLLKNENHTLPLNKNVKKIAVIGALADSRIRYRRWLGGRGAVRRCFEEPSSYSACRFEEETSRRRSSLTFRVRSQAALTRRCSTRSPTRRKSFRRLKPRSTKRLPRPRGSRLRGSRDRGAGRNRQHEQRSRIARVDGPAGHPGADAGSSSHLPGKPVVLVLENGRPLDIHWAAQHVPAILEAWYPGSEGGNAVSRCAVRRREPRRQAARQLGTLGRRGAALLQPQPHPRTGRPAQLHLALLGCGEQAAVSRLDMASATRPSSSKT